MAFTAEELEAIRLADEEIEREWVEEATERQINAEIDKWVDEMAVMDLLDKKGRQQRAYKREYYEAHKDEIAAYQREYREAHKDEIAAYQREYREANREKYNAYMREYMRTYAKNRRRKKKMACQRIKEAV